LTEQGDYSYDVFISYSHADKDWVRRELLPNLEARSLRICIDFRDFQPGAPSVTEMERAVLTSRKTLLILTPDYVESAWAEFEALMLQAMDPASRGRRLIPLLKEKCNLPLRIRYLTYVNFADPEDWDIAWIQLLTALEAPEKHAPPLPKEARQAAQRRDAALRELHDLRRKLITRCNLSDLKDLCFVMGIDHDNYPNVKNDFIRALLTDLQNWGRLDEFVETLRREKPWVLR
jgi:hypothetical protein